MVRRDPLERRAEGGDGRLVHDTGGLGPERPVRGLGARRRDRHLVAGLLDLERGPADIVLAREVEEVHDPPRAREVVADRAQPPEEEQVELRCRGALLPEPVEEAHDAPSSARSRSAHSASASSRPTESRRSPGGTRSPSQRARASIRELTPPRLVEFSISVVAVSTRLAAWASATSNERRPPNPGWRTTSTAGCPRSRSASSSALSVWRRTLTSSVSRPRSRSHATSGAATDPVRDRNSSRRAASSGLRHTTAPTSASSWPARYFVPEWSAKS